MYSYTSPAIGPLAILTFVTFLTSEGTGASLLLLVATTAVPVGSQPMKLRATATPIETPMPAVPPTPTATEAATTFASIALLMSVMRLRPPRLCRSLSLANAFAFVRMTFVDSAPAPLTAMPAVAPTLAASEAATEMASIDAPSVACSAMPPAPA